MPTKDGWVKMVGCWAVKTKSKIHGYEEPAGFYLISLSLSHSEFVGGRKEKEEMSDREMFGLVREKRKEKNKEIMNQKERRWRKLIFGKLYITIGSPS